MLIKTNEVKQRIKDSSGPILCDGAMGTMLNNRGFGFDQCFDELNLSNPALVGEIHRAYIDAGAEIIETNTFGANRYKLGALGLDEQLVEINRAGVELAGRVVMASFKQVYIAGSVGPLGVRLAPFGRVKPEHAREAFAEQIRVLVEAGVDLLILETFSDLYEIETAVQAAFQVSDLPVVASMTFTRDDRTLLGDSPRKVAQALSATGTDIIGVNCSGGPAQIFRILRQMQEVVPDGKFSAQPNAGWPEQVGGRIMYPANPDYFSEYALAFCNLGVAMIGGCCGTTPEHTRAMRDALDTASEGCGPSLAELHMPSQRPFEIEPAEPGSQMAKKLGEGKFVIAVEMDPPRGLSTHKLHAGASLLAEAGADVINVADSPMARMRMSPWAVCDLIQRRVGIETTLHFPTRGRNLLRVQGDLLAAHALNIRNVFVVMGDPTEVGDYPDAMDDYDLVPSGLIRLIKQNFNLGIDHAGTDIGQPTSFIVGCALNLCPQDPAREMRNLKRKLESGADFVLTQPVYEPQAAGAFIHNYEQQYGPIGASILVGVLPLYSNRHVLFLDNEVPGIIIPAEMQDRIREAGEDAPQEGVQISVELIEQVRSWAEGVYLMPQFNRFDLAAEIIERCRNQGV